MKRVVLIGTTALLTACQPPSDDTPGVFEPFDAARIPATGCAFVADGATDQTALMFATREGNPDFMAHVQFKGELLKLVPREVPDFDSGALDITYDVVDYLKWKVRLLAEPTGTGPDSQGYDGSLTLLRDGTELMTSADIYGECGV